MVEKGAPRDVVYTADRSAGRLHRRFREGRQIVLAGSAACPWSALDEYELVASHDILANAEPDRLCSKCWPRLRGDW